MLRKSLYTLIGGGVVSGTNIWAASTYGTATGWSGTIEYPDVYPAGLWNINYTWTRQNNATVRVKITANYEDGTSEVLQDKEYFRDYPYDTMYYASEDITFNKPWKGYTLNVNTNRSSTNYCYAGTQGVSELYIKRYM